ncbi:MAG: ComF family protein [Pseudomonadota bacterium]
MPVIEAACRRCALALPQAADHCGRCLSPRPAYDYAVAAWRYQPPLTGLVQRYKFSADLAAGRMLAALLAQQLCDLHTDQQPDLLIPVPLHWTRHWRRGFNQSERLVQDLTQWLDIPWQRALHRTRATQNQSALLASQRSANVRGAFTMQQPIDAKHVVLVDDVMTTGATLNECAKVLKSAGVDRVGIWVLARA